MDHNSTGLSCRALDRWPGLSAWTQIQVYGVVHRDPEKQRKQLTVKGEHSLVSLSGSRMSLRKNGIRIRGTMQTEKSGFQTKSSSKGCKSQPEPRDEHEERFYNSCLHSKATQKSFLSFLSHCLPSSSLLPFSVIPVDRESFWEIPPNLWFSMKQPTRELCYDCKSSTKPPEFTSAPFPISLLLHCCWSFHL